MPPVAIAGPDRVLNLPFDSVLLDGSGSSDPDGKITQWLWTKISGPVSFVVADKSSSKTTVRKLVTGVYQFELKVTDDKGLSARDTVMTTVTVMAPVNHPPKACAGADQAITLPVNFVTLDGSCSTDPDNDIVSYNWSKISGPASSQIVNPGTVQTRVSNLVQGIYQFELKVTDAGGSVDKDTVQVTVNPQAECPQPSPPPPCTTNCDKLVFVSNRNRNDEIYTCNADGSSVTRLTNDPAWDKQPAWSPDGTKIAFVRSSVDSLIGGNIYIMNADGSNVVQLTFTGDAEHPAWSPDGTKIAFTDEIDEAVSAWVSTIKVVNSSSGSVEMQTSMYGSSINPCPAWSPDGTKIAFDSDWSAWDFISDIFSICPQGSGFTTLTPEFFNDYDYWKPSWSPNGSKLSVTIYPMAYQGSGTVPARIGVMNPDGTGLSVITTGDMGAYNAVTKTSWSPDGTRIAYTSWGTNNTKTIKWIAADGSGASGTIITNGWDADWKH